MDTRVEEPSRPLNQTRFFDTLARGEDHADKRFRLHTREISRAAKKYNLCSVYYSIIEQFVRQIQRRYTITEEEA